MSNMNRGDRIQLLHKSVTKHYTPIVAAEDRNVLEQLVYACCLESDSNEQADEAFHRLQESFFDWNEIRVTTLTELTDALHNLSDPKAAATRIKQNLQSLFESRYSFDLEDMIKMNLGKATQELEQLTGMSKFVLAYTAQNALGGHSIPVSDRILEVLLACEIINENELKKKSAPGLERTVPKTKGAAFGSCLHQMALAFAADPDEKTVKAALKDAGAPARKPAKKAAKATTKKAAGKKAATKASTKAADEKPAATKKKAASKKAASSPPAETKKKVAPKKKAATKAPAKKATKRKPR